MKKTLVVLAAGMGSRFGGLKQIEPVGLNGEFIIDYSVHDAQEMGFQKVVFVIKKEMEEVFRNTIGKRIENKMEVKYVFQEMDNLPQGVTISSTRVKPLGTAHALYCARTQVNEDFAVISADDFYGKEAFSLLSKYLEESKDFGVIGYEIGKTLPKEGVVKRGICFTNKGVLTDIVESTVERKNGKIYGKSLEGDKEYLLKEEQPVSMLMYALRKEIFDYIEEDMKEYFKDGIDNNSEYLLPNVLALAMKKGVIKIDLIPTKSKWVGITYKNDLEELKKQIRELIEMGEEPRELWK